MRGSLAVADILDMGVLHEIIEKSGTWLAFENEKLGQGKENARKFLKENPKILDKIEKMIRAKIREAKVA